MSAHHSPFHPRRLLTTMFFPALLLGALLALAGCMHVNRALTINRDGSGVYVLTVGFREPTAGDPNSVNSTVVTPMEAFGAHVQKQGGTYRRYEDQGYEYWEFTRPFTSISQANGYVQEDPSQDDPNHNPLLYHDTLHVTSSNGLGSTTFHVAGSISLADPDAKSTSWTDATETLAVTMPSGISGHTGGAQNGNTVTYTIHYNESATVDVSGNVSSGFAGCGGSAALVIVAAGLSLLLRAARLAGGASGH